MGTIGRAVTLWPRLRDGQHGNRLPTISQDLSVFFHSGCDSSTSVMKWYSINSSSRSSSSEGVEREEAAAAAAAARNLGARATSTCDLPNSGVYCVLCIVTLDLFGWTALCYFGTVRYLSSSSQGNLKNSTTYDALVSILPSSLLEYPL